MNMQFPPKILQNTGQDSVPAMWFTKPENPVQQLNMQINTTQKQVLYLSKPIDDKL